MLFETRLHGVVAAGERRYQRMEHGSVSLETLAAQALGEVDPVSGGLAPVINPSTSYERRADSSYREDRQYTRADNPTVEHAEHLLAALEGAGCACALFASGMAAATAVFQSLLPGDHVLVSRVLYWGVRKWLAEFGLTWGLDVEFTDTSDLDAVRSAIRPGRTRLLWVETPANPMWDITDLAAVCELAHSAGVRVAVDNTDADDLLARQQPPQRERVAHSGKGLHGPVGQRIHRTRVVAQPASETAAGVEMEVTSRVDSHLPVLIAHLLPQRLRVHQQILGHDSPVFPCGDGQTDLPCMDQRRQVPPVDRPEPAKG
jgi:Cys/Met metabolism PLP-dependent enzyme